MLWRLDIQVQSRVAVGLGYLSKVWYSTGIMFLYSSFKVRLRFVYQFTNNCNAVWCKMTYYLGSLDVQQVAIKGD